MEPTFKYRSGEVNVSKYNTDGTEDIFYRGVMAKDVNKFMNDFINIYKHNGTSLVFSNPFLVSALMHLLFVRIHPFADGNGRMARLWHTAILSKWKHVFEFIPIESQIEKFQDEYYDAIARCHVSGESTIFIEFMLSQIDRILEDISLQMNEENEQFSETVRKMLEIMEYDTPYTRKTLMEKLGLKSRDGFRRNYLQPALEMNLIQMTLPDKPNSRNQRYMKV